MIGWWRHRGLVREAAPSKIEMDMVAVIRRVNELEGRHVVQQNRIATLALRDHQDDKLAAHIATVNVLIGGLNEAVGRLQEVLRAAGEVLAAREDAKAEFRQGLKDGARLASTAPRQPDLANG